MFQIFIETKQNLLYKRKAKVLPCYENNGSSEIHLVLIDAVLYLFTPIHTACVFSKLTFSPENCAYSYNTLSVAFRDCVSFSFFLYLHMSSFLYEFVNIYQMLYLLLSWF